jgi:hypothetical protein
MVERGKIKAIMKNSGAIMVALTVVASIVYTILDLHIIVLTQESLLLRIVGIIIVSILAYMPYFVSQKILLNTKYLSFFWGLWIVFIVGDAIMRIDLVASIFQFPGFFGIVIYPILFISAMGFLFGGEVIMRKCALKKNCCYKLTGMMKKKYSAIVLKMKKI